MLRPNPCDGSQKKTRRLHCCLLVFETASERTTRNVESWGLPAGGHRNTETCTGRLRSGVEGRQDEGFCNARHLQWRIAGEAREGLVPTETVRTQLRRKGKGPDKQSLAGPVSGSRANDQSSSPTTVTTPLMGVPKFASGFWIPPSGPGAMG